MTDSTAALLEQAAHELSYPIGGDISDVTRQPFLRVEISLAQDAQQRLRILGIAINTDVPTEHQAAAPVFAEHHARQHRHAGRDRGHCLIAFIRGPQ